MTRVDTFVVDRSQQSGSQRYQRSQISVSEAQETIFSFLLSIVKAWAVEDVLAQFRQLFFEYGETASTDVSSGIYVLLFNNNEQDFRHTLKRACYILINNWEVARQYQAIQDLISLFNDAELTKRTISPSLKRLRLWISNFTQSADFEELKLFASRFAEPESPWTSRYASYLLVQQYINIENPLEQREAARSLSQKLKDQYKMDLAMYTAHSQNFTSNSQKYLRNPTVLGDGALRLIKAIVARKGQYSYKSLANLFLEQVKDLNYGSFKKSLIEYLTYSVKQPDVVKTLKHNLGQKLSQLYVDHDRDPIDPSLRLRTCNRLIDALMTEDQQSPSPLFTLLLSQSSSILLAILLLKIVLISNSSHYYLEARIADLIRYYDQFPREQCNWVINFLEVFQVIFAIHTENIEYNLIFPESPDTDNASYERRTWTAEEIEACRIFSRIVSAQEGESTD